MDRVERITENGKWLITWVPSSRVGWRRGWLTDRRNNQRYTFSVTNGRVRYLKIIEPKNVPKYIDTEILERGLAAIPPQEI